jgi:hypothetical protein
MPTRANVICFATVLFAFGESQAASMTTHSTPTKGAGCVDISTNSETEESVKRCPGVSGLSLLIHRSDDRASLSILTRDKATLPLNFWDTVTPTFSTLGPNVEWQLENVHGKNRPVAIVVRVDTVDQTDVAAPRPISFIVVARIRGDAACVIGKVPAKQANATQAARALVNARDSKCLPHIQ